MKSRDLLFAAIIVVVIILLIFLSMTGKKPPPIPPDAVHAKIADQRACLDCHGPGKNSPLKKEHPPKDMCFECHKIKPGVR